MAGLPPGTANWSTIATCLRAGCSTVTAAGEGTELAELAELPLHADRSRSRSAQPVPPTSADSGLRFGAARRTHWRRRIGPQVRTRHCSPGCLSHASPLQISCSGELHQRYASSTYITCRQQGLQQIPDQIHSNERQPETPQHSPPPPRPRTASRRSCSLRPSNNGPHRHQLPGRRDNCGVGHGHAVREAHPVATPQEGARGLGGAHPGGRGARRYLWGQATTSRRSRRIFGEFLTPAEADTQLNSKLSMEDLKPPAPSYQPPTGANGGLLSYT